MEERKLIPCAKLPFFDGDHVEFGAFQKAINHAVKFYPQQEKVITYKSALVGKAKEKRSALIANITNNYEELIRVMESQYGNLDTLIPLLIEEIRVLKPPNEREEDHKTLPQFSRYTSFSVKMKKKNFAAKNLCDKVSKIKNLI